MVCVGNRIIFSHKKEWEKKKEKKKKNGILPLAAMQMDLENIMLGEMSDRERQVLYDIIFMWNLKNK